MFEPRTAKQAPRGSKSSPKCSKMAFQSSKRVQKGAQNGPDWAKSWSKDWKLKPKWDRLGPRKVSKAHDSPGGGRSSKLYVTKPPNL